MVSEFVGRDSSRLAIYPVDISQDKAGTIFFLLRSDKSDPTERHRNLLLPE